MDQVGGFSSQIPATCASGTERDVLSREVNRWRDEWRGYFLAGDLGIVAYNPQKDAEIQLASANLFECWYHETRQVGSWLFVEARTRPYCRLGLWPSVSTCPAIRLSVFELALFVLSDFRLRTLPYLAVLVAICGGLFVLFRRLAREGNLRRFFAPRLSTSLFTVFVASLGIWRFAAKPADVLMWIFIAYVGACVLRYVQRKYIVGVGV
jgi:hypothetical protein